MNPSNNDIISQINVEDEMRESYLSYAMSVIASRALPDVRDGLKPVQRRILFAMREMGMDPSKQHRKCAGIIGEVLKSFHPHGDTRYTTRSCAWRRISRCAIRS